MCLKTLFELMIKAKHITRIAYKQQPEKGDPGAKGAIRRVTEWAGDVQYYAGEAGEEYQDIVYYQGYYYLCTNTHKSNSMADPAKQVAGGSLNWALQNDFNFIASKVVMIGEGTNGWIIDNGRIYHSSGKIELSSDGSIKTSNGKYKVDADGAVTATDGTFKGKIQGDSGYIGDFSITNGELKITDKMKTHGGSVYTMSNRVYSDGFAIDGEDKQTGYHKRTTRLTAFSPGDSDGTLVFVKNVAQAESGYAAQRTKAVVIEAKATPGSGNSVVTNAYAVEATAGQFAGLRPATFVINSSTAASTGYTGYQILMHLDDYAHTYICADSSRTRDLYLPVSPDEGEEIDVHAINAVRILSGSSSRPLVYLSGSAVSNNYFTISNGTSWRFVWTKKHSSYTSGVWIAIQLK